ncbi:MAG: hypothetical protein AB8F78_12010 [Saprospiraceae bacterium]
MISFHKGKRAGDEVLPRLEKCCWVNVVGTRRPAIPVVTSLVVGASLSIPRPEQRVNEL